MKKFGKFDINLVAIILFILVNNMVFALANPYHKKYPNHTKNVFKTSNYGVLNTTSLFKLNLLSPSQTFNQIAIGYITGATNGVDNQIDAVPFALSNTMVSSLINNIDYVIQGRAFPFSALDVVPLGFRAEFAGNYSFAIGDFEGVFASSQDIFVRDNLLGIEHNLKASPYSFTANAGIFNTRFEIVYQQTLGVTNCLTITTWSGGAWTNNTPPTITSKAIFTENFTAILNFTACAIEITGTAVVTIPAGLDVVVQNEIIVASTASLIFENTANLLQTAGTSNQGNCIVKRNTNLERLAYTFWSSPVANQNALAFSPLTLPNRFYTYNETNNSYVSIASPSITNLTPAVGYGIRAPNTFPASTTAQFVGNFSGVPNNGNYRFVATKASNGYNLIGNPYPSTILASAFFNSNPNIDVLHFWNNTVLNASANDNYATQNRTSSTRAVSDPKLPTDFIATGQGFFVKMINPASINFYNAMRSSENATVFFRNATSGKNLFKINLMSPTQTFNQIAIGYLAEATNGIDSQYDAMPFGESATRISSLINSNEYVIQGKSLPFSNLDVVKLGFKTNIAGNYSFTSEAFEGIFANNQNIFLKDNLLGISHNIKESQYNFTSNVGTFNNRFEIVYQAVLGIENPNFNENSVFVYEKDKVIYINSGKIEMKNVTIFDLQGRKIVEKMNINATLTDFNLKVAQQVLVVKIASENGQIITKKIIN